MQSIRWVTAFGALLALIPATRAADCSSAGCNVSSINDCGWQMPGVDCASFGDPVEVRMCELNLRLDGDVTDAIDLGATTLVDAVPDVFGVPPGATGYAEEPRVAGDPNGFNVARSLVLYVPDSDLSDAVDDSFLYIAWDIADLATDGVAPIPFDSDDDGIACDVAPELAGEVEDDGREGYLVEMQACTNLATYSPAARNPNNVGNDTDVTVTISITPQIFPLFTNTNPAALPTSAVLTFPTSDALPFPADPFNPTNRCIDQEVGVCGAGNDVEMVIKQVDSQIVFDSDASVRRFALAQMLFRLQAFSTGDTGDEEFASVTGFTPLPGLEVSKAVRCLDSGNLDFSSNAVALPGSVVQYRIDIRNTGNIGLNVTLTDLMATADGAGPGVDCQPLCGTLSATLVRAGQKIKIDSSNASKYDLQAPFFTDLCDTPSKGFLGSLNDGLSLPLGILQGGTVVRNVGTCGFQAGDRLILTFEAQHDTSDAEGFCSSIGMPDCINRISASGRFAPPPATTIGRVCAIDADCDDGHYCNGVEACAGSLCVAGPAPCTGELNCDETSDSCTLAVEDIAGVADTLEEKTVLGNRDDNIASVDLLCRNLDFVKQVGFAGDEASFVTGTNGLQIPPLPPFSSTDIEFRFLATNQGETTEDITVCDAQLCDDLSAVGAALLDCDLCNPGNNGCVTLTVEAGTTGMVRCVAQLTASELADFVALDDGRPACCAGEAGCAAPGDACYLNCASASASPNEDYLAAGGICDGAPEITRGAFAQLCTEQCDLAVSKQVRCLPECNPTGLDPEEGWVSSPDELAVNPGACLQYRIVTTNISSTGVEICALQFADDLADSNAFAGGPLAVSQSGPVACPSLAPFNWDGAAWTCPLVDAGAPAQPRALLPGERHILVFQGQLAAGANPDLNPVNSATVGGASYCAGTAPLYFDCASSAEVGVDVRGCGLEVTKDVTCDDPASSSPLFEVDDVAEAIPGSTVGFSIVVCNTGEADLTSVTLTDTLTCSDWYAPNSVTAAINGTDVTACICANDHCPTFAELSGLKHLDVAECLPGGIPTNGCLTVNFEVVVPADFAGAGTPLDCENTFRAAGFSDVCAGPDATTCGVDIDTAGIDVRVPAVECDKEVCPDFNLDSACDEPFGADLQLPCDVAFPLRLIYRGTVTNTGETDLSDVRVCDDALIADALAAGLVVGNCDLCAGACDGIGDACASPVDLAIGQTAQASCEITVPTRAAWEAFAGRDSGGDAHCYTNGLRTPGAVSADEYCVRGAQYPVLSTCEANVCIAPPCEIAVTKSVRCIDGCTTRGTVGSPEFIDSPAGDCDGNGVMDLRDFIHLAECLGGPQQSPDPAAGAMSRESCVAAFDIDGDHDVDMADCALFERLNGDPVDSLAVTPGATVEFQVKVTNAGDEPICTLQFSDMLTNGAELCPNPTTTIEFVSSSGVSTLCTVPPAWFMDDGSLFELDVPAFCSGLLLASGDMLLVQVSATIAPDAVGIVRNDVCVRCDPADNGACVSPAGYCGDEVCDETIVPVQECAYDVTKEVTCGEPRDLAGNVNTNALFEAQVKALPGSTNGFLITVCNTGDAELSTIGISDALTCAGWYLPDSLRASVGGVDVTDCLCPAGGCGTIDALNGDHSLQACLGHGLPAGECLDITFEVIPPTCPNPNLAVDCTNVVTVTGHTDLCSPDTNPCGPPQTAVATIDVRCPGIACDKLVCADVNTNGTCTDPGDYAPTDALQLPCDIAFPFDLIYEITVTNTGDTPLTAVEVCDNALLADAVSAGLGTPACELCTGACDGALDGCKTAIDLDTNASATARCTIRVPNRDAWIAFADLDVDSNAGCYTNEASVAGRADADFVCTDNAAGAVSSNCSAEVCLEPRCTLELTCPEDVELDCPACTTPDCTGAPIVTDNCDTTSTGYRDVIVPGDCPQEFTIIRTWYALAECDVYDECIQTIGVRDVAPPEIIACPGDVTIACDEEVPPCNTNAVVAIDSCGPVYVDCRDTYQPGVCPEVIEREYIVRDACGNVSTCGHSITIEDTEGPALTCPADLDLNCNDPLPPCDTSGLLAIDSCGVADVTCRNYELPGTCPRTVLREYIGADDCGNVSTCGQLIRFHDDGPPHLECPMDLVLDCIEDVPPLSTDGVVAMDSCGPVEVECYDISTIGTCPLVIERECRAVDSCQHVTTCGYTITVVDTNGPLMSCPDDIDIDCTEEVPPCDTSGIALDACGAVRVDCVDHELPGTCPRIIEREYIAIDDCGNVSTCGHRIRVHDDEPPSIACPMSSIIDCTDDVPELSTDGVIASDSCGFVEVECHDVGTTGACPRVIERECTAIDLCDNEASCRYTVTILDTNGPVIEACPDDIHIGCEEDIPPCDTSGIGAVDGCGLVRVDCVDRPVPGSCPTIIEREYIAIDECANVTTCGHLIVIDDEEPPMITCPADYEQSCSTPLAPCTTNGVVAIDSCGTVVVECIGDQRSGDCPETVLRKYRALDDCGNVSTCGQKITLVDNDPPRMDCPDDVDLDCGDPIPPLTTNGLASDTCHDVDVDCREVEVPGTCPRILQRTCVATDACGNTSTCGYQIRIHDDEPPVIDTCGPDIRIECDEEIPACTTSGVVAHDACGDVDVDCLGDSSNGGYCPEIITRKYSVTDACGNVSTCGIRIIRDDTTAPQVSCPPDEDCTCTPTWRVIDFETDGNGNVLPAGYRFDGYLPGLRMTVDTDNAVAGHPDLAIVFDSAHWTGNDPDLATPGYHPTNTVPYGKVLIIAENATDTSPPDTLVDDPNDEGGRPAGWIDFAFDDTYAAAELVICDTDEGESTGTIQFFMDATLVGARSIAVLGDNSIQTIGFAGAEFNRLRVNMPGSGSIPEIRLRTLCDPECHPEDPVVQDNCDPDPQVTCTEHVSTGGFGGSEYSWEWEPGEPYVWYVDTAGKWKAISTTYNALTHRLTFTTTFDDQITEGITIVMSNGPAPDQLNAVWAMFYFDANSLANPILTVYTYNGRADRTSWIDGDPYTSGNQGGDLIVSSLLDTSWINALTVTDVGSDRVFYLDIDATPILNHVPQWPNQDGEPWLGAGFDGGIGLWLGSYKFLTTAYANGRLTQWQYPPDGYLDTGHMLTEVECAPSEIIRCCTAVDDCGNSDECCHRLIIADCASCDCSTNGDTTPPALNCPANALLDCGASTDPADTGVATASDNCDSNVAVSFEDSYDRDTLITRTWRAVDQCGNESICHQLLTVGDYNNKVVFEETFDGYVYFPDQYPPNDAINAGLPITSEGAYEHWYGGRFQAGDGGSIDSDLAVQRYGGDGNYTPVGRVADDAGLLFEIDTRVFTYARMTFDWRMFNASSGDKLVVGYYVGDIDFGGDTPDGDNDNMVHRFDIDGPQWVQWTELLRDNNGNVWTSESFELPIGHEHLWVAFWLDNGNGDFAKIDNIKVKAFCP